MLSPVSPSQASQLAPLSPSSTASSCLVGGFQEIRQACSARQDKLALILSLAQRANAQANLQARSSHENFIAAKSALQSPLAPAVNQVASVPEGRTRPVELAYSRDVASPSSPSQSPRQLKPELKQVSAQLRDQVETMFRQLPKFMQQVPLGIAQLKVYRLNPSGIAKTHKARQMWETAYSQEFDYWQLEAGRKQGELKPQLASNDLSVVATESFTAFCDAMALVGVQQEVKISTAFARAVRRFEVAPLFQLDLVHVAAELLDRPDGCLGDGGKGSADEDREVVNVFSKAAAAIQYDPQDFLLAETLQAQQTSAAEKGSSPARDEFREMKLDAPGLSDPSRIALQSAAAAESGCTAGSKMREELRDSKLNAPVEPSALPENGGTRIVDELREAKAADPVVVLAGKSSMHAPAELRKPVNQGEDCREASIEVETSAVAAQLPKSQVHGQHQRPHVRNQVVHGKAAHHSHEFGQHHAHKTQDHRQVTQRGLTEAPKVVAADKVSTEVVALEERQAPRITLFTKLPEFMQQVALAVSIFKAFRHNARAGPCHAARRLWEESYAREVGYWTGSSKPDIPEMQLGTEDLTKAAAEALEAFERSMQQPREGVDDATALGRGLARAIHRFKLARDSEEGFEWIALWVCEAGSRNGQPLNCKGNGALGRPEELAEFSEAVTAAWAAVGAKPLASHRPKVDPSLWGFHAAGSQKEKDRESVFLVDNSKLAAGTHGLGYRTSKDMDAKCACGILAPWFSIVPGYDEGDGWLCRPTLPGCAAGVDTHYLPFSVNNATVLVGDVYIVDNKQLQAETTGLRYWCARPTDSDADGLPAEAPWGSFVAGIDRGDGWLLVSYPPEARELFLPMVVDGIQIISKATPSSQIVVAAGEKSPVLTPRSEALAKVHQDTQAFVELAQSQCSVPPEVLATAQAILEETKDFVREAEQEMISLTSVNSEPMLPVRTTSTKSVDSPTEKQQKVVKLMSGHMPETLCAEAKLATRENKAGLADMGTLTLQSAPKDFDVHAYVYDISDGMAAAISMALVGQQMECIPHTSIVVFGQEWYFSDIPCMGDPLQTIGLSPCKVFHLGKTGKTKDDLEVHISDVLYGEFTEARYDFRQHNCNHFADRVAKFLLDGRGLPEDIVRAVRDADKRPEAQRLVSMFECLEKGARSQMSGLPSPRTPPRTPRGGSGQNTPRGSANN